jgi:hypothetical protein
MTKAKQQGHGSSGRAPDSKAKAPDCQNKKGKEREREREGMGGEEREYAYEDCLSSGSGLMWVTHPHSYMAFPGGPLIPRALVHYSMDEP